jgi:hypothetical protein
LSVKFKILSIKVKINNKIYLLTGITNGSMKFKLAAMVIIGLKQLNIVPRIIILPARRLIRGGFIFFTAIGTKNLPLL